MHTIGRFATLNVLLAIAINRTYPGFWRIGPKRQQDKLDETNRGIPIRKKTFLTDCSPQKSERTVLHCRISLDWLDLVIAFDEYRRKVPLYGGVSMDLLICRSLTVTQMMQIKVDLFVGWDEMLEDCCR